ncbi:MAG: diaminopropionate ammonia-lyase [Proteobacteria bacterium]|nr:diaminopropionate ammonia-lyase [Pseudomonadota bacterium]
MPRDFSRFDARLATFDRKAAPYPEAFKDVLSLKAADAAFKTVSTWPGYAITPLVSLDVLAEATGVKAIHYKQEAARFGLNSFKALGGAYAVFRLMAQIIADKTGKDACPQAVAAGEFADLAATITVACATDGNHGRSVAWGARLFGCKAVIFLHETVSTAREEAIAAFGARIIRTPGNYDDSVREAARMAAVEGWNVVSDTSYPGYTDIPRNVMQGYSVMAEEALGQLGDKRPTHVFLQGGVGGLAAAVVAHLRERLGEDAPSFIVVEPEAAACLLASAEAGVPKAVTGDLDTIMAGLACGEPSLIAWPILADSVCGFMAIEDAAAAETMRLLASGEAGAKLVGGESGVAGLAGFLTAASRADWRKRLSLDDDSVILVFGSEGDTDPDLYQKIIASDA